MAQSKVKLYKNSERNAVESRKPYVPQYQLLGVEPEEYKSQVVPPGTMIAKSNVGNPRMKRAPVRQPYAEVSQSLIGAGKGMLPNVGNNMEQSWSSMDGTIIDDLDGLSESEQIIDNNDYVTDTALGISDPRRQPHFEAASSHSSNNEDLLSVVQDLVENNYLLIVNSIPLCSGPLAEIEDQARSLVFGEHELCDGNPVPIEDIIIIKRVAIKMGLFLE